MEATWKDNYPRRNADGGGGGGGTGTNLTEWYLKQTDLLKAQEAYQDAQERVQRPKAQQAAPAVAAASMPTPWQGLTEMTQSLGINLGEIWKDRENEVMKLREATDEREQRIHEMRVQEIDRRVEELRKLAEATNTNREGNGNSQSHRSRLDEAVDNLIANRLDSLLGGNNQQQLTRDDIKAIALEAVQAGTHSQQSPQQTVDTMISFMTAAEGMRKKIVEMGGGQPAEGANPYLTQAGNMKIDVLRALLENDRETMKLKQDYDIQEKRTQHLGSFTGAIKDNVEGIIAAVQSHREGVQKKAPPVPGQGEQQGGYQVQCSLCGQTSTFAEKPQGVFRCPNCGGSLQLGEPGGPPPRRPGNLEI